MFYPRLYIILLFRHIGKSSSTKVPSRIYTRVSTCVMRQEWAVSGNSFVISWVFSLDQRLLFYRGQVETKMRRRRKTTLSMCALIDSDQRSAFSVERASPRSRIQIRRLLRKLQFLQFTSRRNIPATEVRPLVRKREPGFPRLTLSPVLSKRVQGTRWPDHRSTWRVLGSSSSLLRGEKSPSSTDDARERVARLSPQDFFGNKLGANSSATRFSRRDATLDGRLGDAPERKRGERESVPRVRATHRCRSTRAAASWPTITELTPTVWLRCLFTCHERMYGA